jgi:hypothetical protein
MDSLLPFRWINPSLDSKAIASESYDPFSLIALGSRIMPGTIITRFTGLDEKWSGVGFGGSLGANAIV